MSRSLFDSDWLQGVNVTMEGDSLSLECDQLSFLSTAAFKVSVSGWDVAERLERLTANAASRNSPGFDNSILRHSGISEAAEEAVLNTVRRKKRLLFTVRF
jgi:hypothetical protein